MINKIVKFSCDLGRMGEIESLEWLTKEDEELLDWAREKDITLWFGEVLGKHSDVWCKMSALQCKILTEDQDFIVRAHEIFGEEHFGNIHVIGYLKDAIRDEVYDELDEDVKWSKFWMDKWGEKPWSWDEDEDDVCD